MDRARELTCSQSFPEVEPAPCYLPCFQGDPGVMTFCSTGAWEGHWLSPDSEDVDVGCHPLLGSHIWSQSHRAHCWDRRKQTYAPSWSLERMFPFWSLLSLVLHPSRDYGLYRGIGTKTYIDQWNKMETPEINSHTCVQLIYNKEGKNYNEEKHMVLGKLDM